MCTRQDRYGQIVRAGGARAGRRAPGGWLRAGLWLALLLMVGAGPVHGSVFQDDFSGSLKDGWKWIREDKANYSLTARPGYLQIKTQRGDIWAGRQHRPASNNLKNLLLRPAPSGDFTITTKVDFNPKFFHHTAMLVVYQDDDNYVNIARQYLSKLLQLQMVKEAAGTPETIRKSLSLTTTYLKLEKRSDTYTGYYSDNGTNWTKVGDFTIQFKNLQIGLSAGSGIYEAGGRFGQIPAHFDWFRCEGTAVGPVRPPQPGLGFYPTTEPKVQESPGSSGIFEKTYHRNIYNANFSQNAHIADVDGDGYRELVVAGVLTDYSLIPSPNPRCDGCTQWRIDSFLWDGHCLSPERSANLDVGFDNNIRSAIGQIGGETKIVGAGNLYPCDSAATHAGMGVFNKHLENEHYDWGDRRGKDPCLYDYAIFSAVDVADVDGDAVQEIVAGGSGDPAGGEDLYEDWFLSIRTSDGRAFKEELHTFIDHQSASERITDLFLKDVDCDGRIEIVAVGNAKQGDTRRTILHLFTWDGKTLNSEMVKTFDMGEEDLLHRVSAGDLDGDGRQEIILAGQVKKNGRSEWHVKILRWDGKNLEELADKSWRLEQDGMIEAVEIADVDSDGVTEIVLAGNVNSQGLPESKKDGFIHSYADWHLKVLSLNGAVLEEELTKSWASTRNYDTNGNKIPDPKDEGAQGRVYDLAVGDMNGDGRAEVVLVGEWVWTGWHLKVLTVPSQANRRWTKTYKRDEVVKTLMADPVIGDVFRKSIANIKEVKGVANERVKFTGSTLMFKEPAQAKEFVAELKKKTQDSGQYIQTVVINGITFVLYKGSSLGGFGEFAGSVFHFVCDVGEEVVGTIRDVLSDISLPDFNLPVSLPGLDAIKHLLDIIKTNVTAITGEMLNTIMDLNGGFAGKIKGLTDSMGGVYDDIKSRVTGFANSSLQTLEDKRSRAEDRMGEIAGLIMKAGDFAQVLGKERIGDVQKLMNLVNRDLVKSGLISDMVDALGDRIHGEVGLLIDVNGITLRLGGTHSLPNPFEKCLGEDYGNALFYSSGIRKIEVVINSTDRPGRFISFESWTGLTARFEVKEEEEEKTKMLNVQVAFDGGKVSSLFMPVLNLHPTTRITEYDSLKLTVGMEFGSAFIPTFRPFIPGAVIQVELSRDLGANRVLNIAWNANPNIALQAVGSVGLDISTHVGIGGGVELAFGAGVTLDATKARNAIQALAVSSAKKVGEDAGRSLTNQIKEVVSKAGEYIKELVDLDAVAKNAAPVALDARVGLQYLNAMSPGMKPAADAAGFLKDNLPRLAGYGLELTKNISVTAIVDTLRNCTFALSVAAATKGGIGAETAKVGVRLDAKAGVELGVGMTPDVTYHLVRSDLEAKKQFILALLDKGHQVLSKPMEMVADPIGSNVSSIVESEMSAETLKKLLLAPLKSEMGALKGMAGFYKEHYIDTFIKEITEEAKKDYFKQELAKSDLYLALGLTPVEGGIGAVAEQEASSTLGIALHANGEVLMNALGVNTPEKQKYSLTIGASFATSPKVPVGSLSCAAGLDFFGIEVTQKKDSTESVINPFHRDMPVARMAVTPTVWEDNVEVGAEAKKTFEVENTGKRELDVTVIAPSNLTASVSEKKGLSEKQHFNLDLTADTTQTRTLSGTMKLLTGVEDVFLEVPVNISVGPTSTVSGVTAKPTIWKGSYERKKGGRVSNVFEVVNHELGNRVVNVTAPSWIRIEPKQLNLGAKTKGSFSASVSLDQDMARSGKIEVSGATSAILVDISVDSSKIVMDPAAIRIVPPKDKTQITQTLTVKNEGKRELLVSLKMDSCPSWIKAASQNLNIKPGMSADNTLTITFAKGKSQSAELLFLTNDPDQPRVILPISVNAGAGGLKIKWASQVGNWQKKPAKTDAVCLGSPDLGFCKAHQTWSIWGFGQEAPYDEDALARLLGLTRTKLFQADAMVFCRPYEYPDLEGRAGEAVLSTRTSRKWKFLLSSRAYKLIVNSRKGPDPSAGILDVCKIDSAAYKSFFGIDQPSQKDTQPVLAFLFVLSDRINEPAHPGLTVQTEPAFDLFGGTYWENYNDPKTRKKLGIKDFALYIDAVGVLVKPTSK